MRHIVSNTGPLISLEKLNQGYAFIRRLYDKVLIPPAVLQEVAVGQFATQRFPLPVIPVDDHGLPGGLCPRRPGLQTALARARGRFAPPLPCRLRRGRMVEGRIPSHATHHHHLTRGAGQG